MRRLIEAYRKWQRKRTAIARVKSYKNPDPRCGYPWELSGVGYCWSYATHVDVKAGRTEDTGGRWGDIEAICKGCHLWAEHVCTPDCHEHEEHACVSEPAP